MKQDKISIIILNWNGIKNTLECLESVKKIDYPNFEVIVVDNGSTDGSPDIVRSSFPDVTVLETGINLGFAEGNNVGIRYALSRNSDFVLLLNNDTVVDSQVLSAFLDGSQLHPEAGMFNAKIYYYSQPNKIWFVWANWNEKEQSISNIGAGEEDRGNFEDITETDYACGCALFVKAETIENVGLMDPRFFLLYEETDWCFRAKRAGYKCLYIPKAKVWHKVAGSFVEGSPTQHYFFTRNLLLWAEKHLSRRQYWRLFFKTSLYALSLSFTGSNASSIGKRLLWSFASSFRRLHPRSGNAIARARYLGLRDYVLRRFGNCSDEVRNLGKKA